jgi:hypothetical protein
MDMDARMTVPETVVVRAVGDEVVLLDLAAGEYFGLDAVGARVWELLDCGKSLEEVVTVLLDEFDVTEIELRADVIALVSELVSRGLLEQSVPSG